MTTKNNFKYIIYTFWIVVLVAGCAKEYAPNGYTPDKTSGVEDFFADTISQMPANVKLEFVTNSAKSISASYGDTDIIFYQIILVSDKKYSSQQAIDEYFMPFFEDAEDAKSCNENFYAYAKNDSVEMAVWAVDNFAFFMKVNPKYIELAVDSCKFLEFL